MLKSGDCTEMVIVRCAAVCLPQVWAAIPPWKQGSLAEFVVLSANEVLFNSWITLLLRANVVRAAVSSQFAGKECTFTQAQHLCFILPLHYILEENVYSIFYFHLLSF